jgi:RNA polymerase sigma factor (sigma-70 family)
MTVEEQIKILVESGDHKALEQAFGLLIDAYQRPIYYYIRRMVLDHDDADDLTQTTFINAWKSLDKFRFESKASTWLHTIAYRESIHLLEQRKRICRIPMDAIAHQLSDHLLSDPLYDGNFIQTKLQEAIALLPEKQKAVFIMKYFEEKKYEEIAEITGTTIGGLKASYHHAVTKIETYLKNIPA